MHQPRRSTLAALLIYIAVVKAMPFLLSHYGLDTTRESTVYLWGLTPVFALGIFGVARFRQLGTAMLLPLLAWFCGDLLIGAAMGYDWVFYPGWFMTYLGFAALCFSGLLLRKSSAMPQVLATSLLGSVLFFLVSNFGSWCWDIGEAYPRTLSGLMTCYIAGIPFYKMHLISTLAFSALLFSPLGENFLLTTHAEASDESHADDLVRQPVVVTRVR